MARELTPAEIRRLERRERDESIQRLRDDGYTLREIAEIKSVSVGTVHNALRRLEGPHRPKPTLKEINRRRNHNRERREQNDADTILQLTDPEAWERLEEQREQESRERIERIRRRRRERNAS